MKIALILAIVIGFLAIPALAAPENITTGPYKVSFDMGLPKGSYELIKSDPVHSESLSGDKSIRYEISIFSSLINNALIYIDEDEKAIGLNCVELEMLILEARLDSKGVLGINIANRTIDGVMGAAASGTLMSRDIYAVTYRPSFDPSHVLVTISSCYPWDSGTLQLLKTIHVERTGTVSPPRLM